MFKSITLSFLILMIALAGCVTIPIVNNENLPTIQNHETSLREGIVTEEVTQTYEGQSYQYQLILLDQKFFDAKLEYSQTPKSLVQWHNSEKEELLINGGFFTEELKPTGLFVLDGKIIAEHPYVDDTTASVVVEHKKVSLVNTPTEKLPGLKKELSLFQSFPVLLQNGKTVIKEDSQKLARRTVLAQTKTGNLAIILVDKTPVSLFALATMLERSSIGFDFALNLDGGPSTGLISSISGYEQNILPITPLPIVLRFTAGSYP